MENVSEVGKSKSREIVLGVQPRDDRGLDYDGGKL